MSKKRLKSLRANAFQSQSGRCYYCGLPMWLTSPAELGFQRNCGKPYQCSAEHLIARQDGGRDALGNIVAAHTTCNRRRHQRPGPSMSPQAFRSLVRGRLDRGKWWSKLPSRMACGSV